MGISLGGHNHSPAGISIEPRNNYQFWGIVDAWTHGIVQAMALLANWIDEKANLLTFALLWATKELVNSLKNSGRGQRV
jgi:hypothetical protein